MAVPDDVRRDAENTGELVGKKLLEIMDLQADIDALLRDQQPTPFGSERWKHVSLAEMQRIVAMTAVQLVLFEPDDLVEGNDTVRVAAEELITLYVEQLNTLKARDSE